MQRMLSIFSVFSTLSIQLAFANPAHEQLVAQTPEDQPLYLTLLLQQSGHDCDLGVRSQYRFKDKDQTAYWAVQCRNGQSYMVGIFNDKDGSTRILDCATMKLLDVECFEE